MQAYTKLSLAESVNDNLHTVSHIRLGIQTCYMLILCRFVSGCSQLQHQLGKRQGASWTGCHCIKGQCVYTRLYSRQPEDNLPSTVHRFWIEKSAVTCWHTGKTPASSFKPGTFMLWMLTVLFHQFIIWWNMYIFVINFNLRSYISWRCILVIWKQ